MAVTTLSMDSGRSAINRYLGVHEGGNIQSRFTSNTATSNATNGTIGNDEIKSISLSYVCYLSGAIMRDPHILSDGHSYERIALLRWFAKGHRTSPASNTRLSSTKSHPNIALRNSIEEFLSTRSHLVSYQMSAEEISVREAELKELQAQPAMSGEFTPRSKTEAEEPPPTSSSMAEVRSWLELHNVGHYAKLFQDEGFDSMDAVMMLTEGDMESLGVKTGHRRLLMQALTDTKNKRRAHNAAGLPGSPATSNGGESTTANGDADGSHSPVDLPSLANGNGTASISSANGALVSPRRLEPLSGGGTPTSGSQSTSPNNASATNGNSNGANNGHNSVPASPRTPAGRLSLPGVAGASSSTTTSPPSTAQPSSSSSSSNSESKTEKRSPPPVILPTAAGATSAAVSSSSTKGDSPPAVVTINLPPLGGSRENTPTASVSATGVPVASSSSSSNGERGSVISSNGRSDHRPTNGAGDALPLVVARRNQAKRDGGADEFSKGTSLETARPRPDWKGAFAHFCRAMAQGMDQAILKVAICYLFGLNAVQIDDKKAAALFEMAVSRKVRGAKALLAWCYYHGYGVSEDHDKAVKLWGSSTDPVAKWYRATRLVEEKGKSTTNEADDIFAEVVPILVRHAESGDATAQWHVGVCFQCGYGVPKDSPKAVEWYTVSSEQGHAQSQFTLGWCYEKGFGVEKQPEVAVKWYTAAALQGHSRSQTKMGYCYENARGVERDINQSVYWYKQAAAQGHALAQNFLGARYEKGDGVTRDLNQAFSWYMLSARQGDPWAQWNLGRCYADGKGCKRDATRSLRWYTAAAVSGHVEAQRYLGVQYEAGTLPSGNQQHATGERDMAKAVYYYTQAAQQGNAWCQWKLGRLYAQGQGVEKDDSVAVGWYQLAANSGDVNAQNAIGACYEFGHIKPKDATQAVAWYQRSAAQGGPNAMFNLGRCYAAGNGLPSADVVAACKWYQQAANSGHVEAQYNTGLCYLDGVGVEKDKERAIYWLSQAARQGYEEAQWRLASLAGTPASATGGVPAVSTTSGATTTATSSGGAAASPKVRR